jgi:hypothetical protein
MPRRAYGMRGHTPEGVWHQVPGHFIYLDHRSGFRCGDNQEAVPAQRLHA